MACLSTRGNPNDVYAVAIKTEATKTVWIKRNNVLSSIQLPFIIDFVLIERKLAHGPVKVPGRLISHFVMNIIMANWLNRQSKFHQMTYFQQSAKISSRQNFRPYGRLALSSKHEKLHKCWLLAHVSGRQILQHKIKSTLTANTNSHSPYLRNEIHR